MVEFPKSKCLVCGREVPPSVIEIDGEVAFISPSIAWGVYECCGEKWKAVTVKVFISKKECLGCEYIRYCNRGCVLEEAR